MLSSAFGWQYAELKDGVFPQNVPSHININYLCINIGMLSLQPAQYDPVSWLDEMRQSKPDQCCFLAT